MRIKTMMILFGSVLLIAGCWPTASLHPLFTETDIVFDPALVGTWADKNGIPVILIQKAKDKAYKGIYMDNGGIVEFEAHLVRLGKFLFLDAYPKKPPTIHASSLITHLIPGHTFSRIWIDGDVLRIRMLDRKWLLDMIARKKVKIAHERVANIWGPDEEESKEYIVLTASTKELQKFALKYAENSKAFPDLMEEWEWGEWHRLK